MDKVKRIARYFAEAVCCTALVAAASCDDLRRTEEDKATGFTVFPATPVAGDACVYVFTADGKTLLRQVYSEHASEGVEIPGLSRETDYQIGMLTGAGRHALSPDANVNDLGGLSLAISGETVSRWREASAWPMASLPKKGSGRIYHVNGSAEGVSEEERGVVRVALTSLGHPVGIRIDGTGLGRYVPEIISLRLTSRAGEYHPFVTSAFMKNSLDAPQYPSGRELTALQRNLFVSKATEIPCIFHVLDRMDETESNVEAVVRFHDKADGTAVTRSYIHEIKSSLPEGYSPDDDTLMITLCLDDEAEGPSGGWVVSKIPGGSGDRLVTFLAEDNAVTKATAGADGSISGMHVWVLGPDGETIAYGSSSSGSCTLRVPASAGCTARVVTNLPDGTVSPSPEAACLEDIMTKKVLLKDMGTDRITMYGERKGCDILADGAVFNVSVGRVAAKVSLGTIKNAIPGKTVRVSGLYLINGVGRIRVDGTGSPAVPDDWYNCSAKYSPGATYPDFGQLGVPSLTHDDFTRNISSGGSFSPNTVYYTFPNPTGEDAHTDLATLAGTSSWSARHTRLVIEGIIDGTRYYWPMTLPAVEKNVWYSFGTATITGPGATSPDLEIPDSHVEYDLSIREWREIHVNETI